MKPILVVLIITGSFAAPPLHKLKIIGGDDAAEGEFPYQASIKIFRAHSCGGSIISTKSILTAAHCYNPFVPMEVVVGTIKMFDEGDSYEVQKLTPHPEFNMETIENDVAVINLVKEIVLNDKIQPIALNTADVVAGSSCTLTGWGLTSYPGSPFTDLQKINLLTISNDVCRKMHESVGIQIYDSQVCTLTKVGEGACGPTLVDLLFKMENRLEFILGEYRAVLDNLTFTQMYRLLSAGLIV
ncbi:hypothetical protein FQR65_LT02148 [Abscondita terminalis]|nr:hypothetical protein FQR65_LT02148 [Abscondita terminalis]